MGILDSYHLMSKEYLHGIKCIFTFNLQGKGVKSQVKSAQKGKVGLSWVNRNQLYIPFFLTLLALVYGFILALSMVIKATMSIYNIHSLSVDVLALFFLDEYHFKCGPCLFLFFPFSTFSPSFFSLGPIYCNG